jgi:uncharacterized protein (TIGR02757 family)
MDRDLLGEKLEGLYCRVNRAALVSPDPLERVRGYEEVADREVAALVAASLAYGRVRQILASLGEVFGRTGPPGRFVREQSAVAIRRALRGFRHRFTDGAALGALLAGVKSVLEAEGSLEACFARGLRPEDETVEGAASAFVERLREGAGRKLAHVLPSPRGGSACKRLMLFLRWLVRRDEVDPGGWERVPASKLVVPLDVHLHRAAVRLGLTRRASRDWRTALEVTAGFRTVAPADPARYDFVLTRLGIRRAQEVEEMFCELETESDGDG